MSSPELGTDENESNLQTSRSAMDADPAPAETGTPTAPAETTPPSTSPAPATSTSSAKSTKSSHRPHKKHKLICVLSLIATCILLVGVSFMVGRLLSQPQTPNHDATTTPNPDTPGSTDTPLPNEAGTPLKDITLIPEQDQLVLAFLKLHNDQENSCYSPLSIRYALSMLREGAGGETRHQIDQLLGDLSPKRYNNIADHLSLANALWVKTGLENGLQPGFVDTLQDKFGASLKVDDFNSAANINAWIKDNTLGLLNNALEDSDVLALKAALVNVLAIDMHWEREFDKLSTTGGYFGDSEEANTTTMRVDGANAHLYYHFADDATVFASDLQQYGDTRLQFVAIQPDNLQTYVANLDLAKINHLLSNLRVALPANNTYTLDFTAYAPKFKIDGGLPSLIKDLNDLGITDAFDADKADFSNLTSSDGFFIDTAKHKTLFEFTEEGIRAAALTVFGGKGAAGPPYNLIDITVVINKPFLYLVRDVDSGDVWFIGTVYHPEEWDESKKMYTE